MRRIRRIFGWPRKRTVKKNASPSVTETQKKRPAEASQFTEYGGTKLP